jgi:2'-5' RNA ligase
MALTRTFLAIELDDTTRAFIRGCVDLLRQALPRVRFVAEETWHITLAFLGELDDAQLAAARQAAQKAALLSRPFTLHAAGIGTFGGEVAPRVIWIGVAGMTRELAATQQQVVNALHAMQVPYEDEKRFSPHITLARLRAPLVPSETQQLRQLETLEDQGPDLPATAISVMKSELSQSGARYTCLERAAFAGE